MENNKTNIIHLINMNSKTNNLPVLFHKLKPEELLEYIQDINNSEIKRIKALDYYYINFT